MKPSLLLLPSLLLASLPLALDAAPGTLQGILQKVTDGSGVTLANNHFFGISCAVIGDLDGDGVTELAVGALQQPTKGAVHLVFLNSDGTVKSSTKIADGSGVTLAVNESGWGKSCTALGDFDRDGVPDLAVGTSSAIYFLYLNRNGSVRSSSKIANGIGGLPAGTIGFGESSTVVGDFDGDGVPELVVGDSSDSTGGPSRGSIHLLFLNANGTVKSLAKIAHGSGGLALLDDSRFGSSCTVLGDLDGDGVPELAVGAYRDDTGGDRRGAIYILFLNADGSLKSSAKIASGSGGLALNDGDIFGNSCTSPGDLDGDGVPDLAVGAPFANGFSGALHLIFLNANGTVKSLAKIESGSGGLSLFADDEFGFSCASFGDLNGNGVPDLLVGAEGDSSQGMFRGAAYLIEIGDPPLTVTTLADEFNTPSGANLSLREAIRDADAANEFRTIRFDPALSGQEVEILGGANGPLAVSSQTLRITGEGLVDGLTLLGDFDRIFNVNNSKLTVDQVNLRGGSTSSGGGAILVGAGSSLFLDRVTVAGCDGFSGGGGAIQSEGSVVITNSTFLDNTANPGGAIFMLGATADLKVSNSTFARNSSTGGSDGGGAIFNSLGAAATLQYCTFVGNSTDGTGGGIFNDSGTVVVGESLFSGNTAAISEDFDNATTNAGGNALAVPASQLMTFGDYGGPTPVQPLKPTSAAKNTAFHRPLPATDQRGPGFPRTDGSGRDPGAVEGLESRDFQPDSRIGLSAAKQIGNNRYNTSGQGQTVKLALSGRKKTSSFFTVENDGFFVDGIRLRSVAPNKKTLRGSVFRLTGGRSNVSAQVFRGGLALGDLNPGATVAFQADWSRKSATAKVKQTLKITASSTIAPKSDVVGAKVDSK